MKKLQFFLTLVFALFMQFIFAQEKTVTGIVKDSKGSIAGVNVAIKGTNKATSTDFNGGYSIKANVGETLVFSFIGMGNQTRTVNATNNVFNINLQQTVNELDVVNIVNTSFGIKKRKDALVSSTQVVGNKELNQAASPNIIQSLAGKVSGLQINQTSSGVTGTTKVVLRGPRTITGNNEAMVVVDGAISSLGVLSQLPTELIENVTVLKGQQGGTLYGEQGSNGVIIVTTKKGNKGGKLSVSLNSSLDFQNVSYVPETQTKYGQGWYGYDFDINGNASDPRNNSEYFSPIENGSWGESLVNGPFAGTIVPVGLPQPDGTYVTDVYSSRGKNNVKDFYRTGIILQNGFTINSGTEDGYALLSFNRQTTDFVVEKDDLKRNNILFKAGKKFGKFNIDGSINYTNTTTSTTDATLLDQLIQTPTNVDINKFRNAQHPNTWTSFARNPFRLIDQIRNDDTNDLFIGNLGLSYAFNKNITLNYNGNIRGNYATNSNHDDGYKFSNYTYNVVSPFIDNDYGTNYTYGLVSGGGDSGSEFFTDQSYNRTLYNDLVANFNYDLNNNFNLKFNIGAVVQDSKFKIATQGGTNLDVAGFYHISNVLAPSLAGSLDNRLLTRRSWGTFANGDLAFKDYLFLNAGVRYDKASIITKGYFYPTVGFSFIGTKAIEALKDSKILNYLKVNGSYSTVGNASPVNTYATNDLGTVASGFPYGDLVGYEQNRFPTEKFINPEFITTKEFGINLGFFKDRVTLDASAYITDTKDLITNKLVSTGSGIVNLTGNIGALENKGFEIDLGLTPFKSTDNGFTWNIKASYATYKTKITALAPGVPSVPLQSSNGNGFGVFAEVGEEFPLIKGTTFVRNDAGQIIVDAAGNPSRNANFSKLGNSNPDYILGLTNTFNFRGFQLTLVADYRTGHSFYSETYRNLQFTGGAVESAEQDRFSGYVIPGSVQLLGGVYVPNTTPAFSNPGYTHGLNGQVNDYFNNISRRTGETSIIDATALKIRELALSYSLPSKLIKSAGISSFRIGLNARNPFVFFFADGKHGKKNLGYSDPESSNTGGNGAGVSNIGQYPTLRTLGFSMNVTF